MNVSQITSEITSRLGSYDKLRTLVLVGSLQDISEQEFKSRMSWDMDLLMIVDEVRPDVPAFLKQALMSACEELSSNDMHVSFDLEEGPVFRKAHEKRSVHIQLMLHDSASIMRESPLIMKGWVLGKHLAGSVELRSYSRQSDAQPNRTLLVAPLGLLDSLKMIERGQVRRYYWKTIQGKSVRMRAEEHLDGVHLALLNCYCALNSLRNFARCSIDREVALNYSSDIWLSQLEDSLAPSIVEDAKYVWNQRKMLLAEIERPDSYDERQELRKRCQRMIERLIKITRKQLKEDGPAVAMDGVHFSLLWVADLSLLLSEQQQQSFRYEWLAGKHAFESLEHSLSDISEFEQVNYTHRSYPEDTFLGAFLRPGHSCDWFQKTLVYELPSPQRIEAGSLARTVSCVSLMIDERLTVCLRIDLDFGEDFDLGRILISLPELERVQKYYVNAVFGAEHSCSFVAAWNRVMPSRIRKGPTLILDVSASSLLRFKESCSAYSICVMDVREISHDWRDVISAGDSGVRKIELSAQAVEFGKEITALFSKNPYHQTRSTYSLSYVASILQDSKAPTNDEVLLINDRSIIYLPPPSEDRSEEENNRRIRAIDSRLPAIASVVLMASVWKHVAMGTTDRLHREVALLFEKSVKGNNYNVRSGPLKKLVGQLYAVATGLRHLEQILSFEERTSSRMTQNILEHLKEELRVDEVAFQKEAAQIETLANICHQGILQIQNNRLTVVMIMMTVVMLILAIVGLFS